MLRIYDCLATQHDLRFVTLAALVCLCGAVAVCRLVVTTRRETANPGLARRMLTGMVAGSSVWATHFIAMLGFDPHLATAYEPVGTAASLLIAICGLSAAFALFSSMKGWPGLAMSGGVMGLSIAGMHFTGMTAFQTEGALIWDPVLLAVAVGSSLVISIAAMAVLRRAKGWPGTAAAAGVMTLGICALHFIAMGAVTVAPLAGLQAPELAMSKPVIAGLTAGIATLVLCSALLISTMERWNRRAAFDRLHESIEAMSEGLAYYDAQDRLEFWNTNYRQTSPEIAEFLEQGVTFEQVLRLGLERGHYQEAQGREEEWLVERLAARQRCGEAIEQQMSDGRWLRVQDRRSALGGTVSLIVDVTDLKRAAEDLARARDAAEAANRAKSEFLANMSHEIRTPLNGILGVADVLSKTDLRPDQSEMLELISASGVTLQQLLSDILDLARVESGRLSLTERPFDLGKAVREAAQLYAAPARAKGLSFYVDQTPTAEAWVQGDVVRFKQILTNLVSNAVKFTQSGFVRLTAERAADRNGRSVFRFTVEDTGVGFDQAARARLFARFEQADGSITRQFGGSGLGLAICRQLSEMMGGDLDCESEPGGGSTFILTVPMALTAAPDAPPVEAPVLVPAADAAGPGHRARILLADDHPTNRKVIELILSQAPIDLVSVENGAQAVEMFEAQPFDLVLMDMQMPVMDGLTATRALRDLEGAMGRARTPVIMLTANALAEHVEAGRAAGADRHLSKPVSAQTLLAAVAEATSEPFVGGQGEESLAGRLQA